MYFRLPPVRTIPSSASVPLSPFPGFASKPLTSCSFICRADVSSMMAFARGCSLFFSRAPAYSRSFSCVTPSAGTRSVTFGSPLVMVPVLSSAMICVRPAFSRDEAVLNRIPFLAPFPFPTIIATGVASPRAHGQLMTRTEIALASANDSPLPVSVHTANVKSAIPMTAGTKIPLTLSAILAIGAFVAAASDTIWMIWLRVVSVPTLVARHRR